MTEPIVMTGRGTYRVTIQDGGIVMFECWDTDEDGKVLAYWSAGAPPRVSKDSLTPGEGA